MQSTHNDEKSVVAERFIRILKNKTYKYLTSISKKMYIEKIDDVVDKYNNTYLIAIEMKSVDAKLSAYIESLVKKLMIMIKIGDVIRISIYKNISVRLYSNWSAEVFLTKQVKKTLCYEHMLLVILKVKKMFERFTK